MLAESAWGTLYTHDTAGLIAGVRLFLTHENAPHELDSPEAVYRLPATAFAPVTAQAVELTPRAGASWLKIELPPALMDGSRVWLELRAPFGARIDVYDPQGGRWHHTGDQGPLRTIPRSLVGQTRVVTLQPRGPLPVLLRLAVAQPTTLSLELWHPETWAAQQMYKDFAWGLYCGLLLATLGFAAMTAALLQARELRVLAAFLAAALGVVLCNGILSSLWLADYPDLARTLVELAVVGFFVTAAWATHSGLCANATPPSQARLIRTLLGVTAVGASLLVLLGYPTGAVRGAFVVWLGICLAALGQGVARWRTGGTPSAYPSLLLGWQMLGGAVLFVMAGGQAQPAAALAALWQTSLVLFAAALGVVTVIRIRADHVRRLRENTGALLASQQAQTLLNEQVKARTGALNQALHQLTAALAREQAAQARRAEFLRGVAHDLRTPLAVLQATIDNLLVADPAMPTAAAQDDYRLLERTGQRLAKTIDLHLSPTSGALAAEAEAQVIPCDPAALVRDTVEAARVLSADHHFVVATAALPAQLVCDPEMTRVALRNLLDNAVKYTPPGSTIQVRGGRVGQRQSDAVWLAVADNGPGVPAAELDALFTPGFRAGSAAGQPGQGLGLPLARRMIESQGGRLTVTTNPGTGLTFMIWLPATAGEEDPDPPSAVAATTFPPALVGAVAWRASPTPDLRFTPG